MSPNFHPMNFSVLVSVYLGTKASELATCFESLLSQTLPAKEIVVVIDGPLTTDTEHCLNQYCGRLPIKLLPFPINILIMVATPLLLITYFDKILLFIKKIISHTKKR